MHNIFLVDLPANALWQTLCDEFPEAKVILVVRDEDKWINSLLNHIEVSFYFFNLWPFCTAERARSNQKWTCEPKVDGRTKSGRSQELTVLGLSFLQKLGGIIERSGSVARTKQ